MKSHKLAVVIMRAQLPTVGHFYLLEEALKKADDVLLLIGSANRSPSARNPFNWMFRRDMIKAGLEHTDATWRIQAHPLNDHCHMEYDWEAEVQTRIEKARTHLNINSRKDVAIVGSNKDESTYYMDSFPMYGQIDIPQLGDGINATMVRNMFFAGNEEYKKYTRPQVVRLLEEYQKEDGNFGYSWMQRYFEKVAAAQAPYTNLPYGIKFMTSDPIIMCGDHVLLIKRGDDDIGAGLHALPGGYVNPGETTKQALWRELDEETNIDVPLRALRQGFRGEVKFEGLGRDCRGDFTTFAGFVQLEKNANGTLPKVKAGSDAKEAKWFPLYELPKMAKYIFLDHLFIIEVMRRKFQSGEYSL